jgi:hypothetical protein
VVAVVAVAEILAMVIVADVVVVTNKSKII